MPDVAAAVLSLSARSPEGRDAEYLAWHLLDHLPEQFRIPELRQGHRFVSTAACRAARAAEVPPYDGVDHVVQYLFAEPLAPALDRFFSLGAELREAGRMPIRLPAVELAAHAAVGRALAPGVDSHAEVLPWRPAHGAYVLLERRADGVEHPGVDDLLAVDGVAGAWWYRGRSGWHPRLPDNPEIDLTFCYLDGDPAQTGERLRAVVEQRPLEALLAAPLAAVTPWAWDRSLPG